MEEFWHSLIQDLPTTPQLLEVTCRMLVATILGGIIGLERGHAGQAAGLRTHMLVALGTAMFILVPLETKGSKADLSRVIQGIATGIGFVGAGAILKLADREQIKGLTTAASLWLTAGAGMAVGMGRIWIATLGSILAWLVLSQLKGIEARLHPPLRKVVDDKTEPDSDVFAGRN